MCRERYTNHMFCDLVGKFANYVNPIAGNPIHCNYIDFGLPWENLILLKISDSRFSRDVYDCFRFPVLVVRTSRDLNLAGEVGGKITMNGGDGC